MLGNDGSTEVAIIAVDERTAIALCISYGEIDGIGMVVSWRAMLAWWRRLLRVEELGPFGKIGGREEFFRGNFAHSRVSYPPSPIGKGNLKGLDDCV